MGLELISKDLYSVSILDFSYEYVLQAQVSEMFREESTVYPWIYIKSCKHVFMNKTAKYLKGDQQTLGLTLSLNRWL